MKLSPKRIKVIHWKEAPKNPAKTNQMDRQYPEQKYSQPHCFRDKGGRPPTWGERGQSAAKARLGEEQTWSSLQGYHKPPGSEGGMP